MVQFPAKNSGSTLGPKRDRETWLARTLPETLCRLAFCPFVGNMRLPLVRTRFLCCRRISVRATKSYRAKALRPGFGFRLPQSCKLPKQFGLSWPQRARKMNGTRIDMLQPSGKGIELVYQCVAEFPSSFRLLDSDFQAQNQESLDMKLYILNRHLGT